MTLVETKMFRESKIQSLSDRILLLLGMMYLLYQGEVIACHTILQICPRVAWLPGRNVPSE